MTSRRGFSRKTIEDKAKRDPTYLERFRKTVSKSLGASLRVAREAAGLSQKAVAERMGVTEARVTQLEGTDGNSITLRSLRRYANAVGCRLDINLVKPEDSTVVARLYVVDDYSGEPEGSVAQAVSATKQVVLSVKHRERTKSPSVSTGGALWQLVFAQEVDKLGSTGPKLESPTQPNWVKSDSPADYSLAGV